MSNSSKQFIKSNISIKNLYNVLKEDKNKFINYTCKLISESKNNKIEQEYTKSEIQGKDEKCIILKELWLSKDFLLPYLIDYWYIVFNKSGFETYLKETRTPNSKKQAEKLIEIYKNINC